MSSESAGSDVLLERILRAVIRKLAPSLQEEYQSRSEYMSTKPFLSCRAKIELYPFMHISVYKLTLIERAALLDEFQASKTEG